tara:strand:+ start:4401 stop:4769 length:369 start_codon:yes stop_codon:yes gene_type:complete
MKQILLLFSILIFTCSFAGTSFENDVGNDEPIEFRCSLDVLTPAISTVNNIEIPIQTSNILAFNGTLNTQFSINDDHYVANFQERNKDIHKQKVYNYKFTASIYNPPLKENINYFDSYSLSN